jgi:hypothetical protein
VAALIAVIVLGEHLAPIGWLGPGLLFAGLLITAANTRPSTTSHLGHQPSGAPDRALSVTVNADVEHACGARTTETGTTTDPNTPGTGACSQSASIPPSRQNALVCRDGCAFLVRRPILCGHPLTGVGRFPNLAGGPAGPATHEALHCCQRA